MSIKEEVIDRIRDLPDDVDAEGIRQRLSFIIGVREAIDSVDRGETIAQEEVKGRIREWASK